MSNGRRSRPTAQNDSLPASTVMGGTPRVTTDEKTDKRRERDGW
jgi:hypothetical protein